MSQQMQLDVETLQRDAAALFSFVDSICIHCYQDSESPAYLNPSIEFFKYIRELGDATKHREIHGCIKGTVRSLRSYDLAGFGSTCSSSQPLMLTR